MTEAYILVQTEVGRAGIVTDRIKNLSGVVTAEIVSGPYDVIVRSQATDESTLRASILSEIQKIDHVTRTLTCQVIHP